MPTYAHGQTVSPFHAIVCPAGVLAFGAAALAALLVAPDLGAYIVAIALLGHAAWDVYHHLRNRVVVRSYAEFCAVADLLLGAAILFIT